MRLEILVKFFLALASTVFLLISGVVLPAAGVILMPFVPQPVLLFGLKYGVGLGVGVLIAAMVCLFVIAGEALGFVYSVFAVMVGLLFWLLGRLRTVELLVTAVAAAMLATAAGILLHFYGSWGALTHDLRSSLIDNLTVALRVHEKMGFPQESLNLFREKIPEIVEQLLRLLPGLLFVSLCLVVLLNILFLLRRFPERRDSMVVACVVPRVEMSGTVGLGAHCLWLCLFCSGERGGDDRRVERSSSDRCLLLYSRARHRGLFFSQEQRAAVSAQRDLYPHYFSTNLHATGCSSGFV